MKNGTVLPGQNASAITLGPVSLNDAGVYSVAVTGANGAVTNSATLTLLNPTSLAVEIENGSLALSWPVGYTGWRLQAQTNILGTNWWTVMGSDETNRWIVPLAATNPNMFFRLSSP
jgi:hypothetical protein